MAKVTVLGGGGWAIALAKVLNENGNDVTLWSFLQREVDALKNDRENKIGLPGIKIPESVQITNDMAEAVKNSEMIVMAVASSLKTAILTSKALEELGFEVSPRYNEESKDIFQSIIFNDKNKLIIYCHGIQ